MLAPATVDHVAAAAHHVEAFGQAGVAARAGHAFCQGLVLVGAVFVQQAEQLDHRLGRELEVFVPVKPQALAGKTDVQLQRVPLVAGEPVGLHGLAAVGAGRLRVHGGGAHKGQSGVGPNANPGHGGRPAKELQLRGIASPIH